MFQSKNRAAVLLAALPLLGTALASTARADDKGKTEDRTATPLFLTATNGANNFLAVVDTRTKVTTYVPTGGFGGAGGNAGGVAVDGRLAAAVNFGSTNVTIFVRRGDAMEPTEIIQTASQPVSVAFGHNHLVVLGQTTAESFPVYGGNVAKQADGMVQLLKADKTAAQIVTFDGGAIYSEKSGSLAELSLSDNGIAGLSGPNRPVLLPSAPNNDTPFGMIARDANVYVTIAHSNLQALVVNGQIVATAAGLTPFKDASGGFLHAPCWNALSGQFLYSSDSPGKQILRYLVSDNSVFFDKPGVAKLGGAPTDITVDENLLGVIDGGDGTTSNATLFEIDSEGELTLRFAVKIAGPITGAAIIR
ncbi:MAG TPA: hypothetical protein VNV86_11485 [Candidatus Acidoferrum sp.]|nr:hypothetical protein [Candidatus Acidoferrum sp.]